MTDSWEVKDLLRTVSSVEWYKARGSQKEDCPNYKNFVLSNVSSGESNRLVMQMIGYHTLDQ